MPPGENGRTDKHMGKFQSKRGRELHTWEVPVQEYMASEPPTTLCQRRAWHTHLLAVAEAIRASKDVPAAVRACYSDDVLAVAALEIGSVLGDMEASQELAELARTEGRERHEPPRAYVTAQPTLYGAE